MAGWDGDGHDTEDERRGMRQKKRNHINHVTASSAATYVRDLTRLIVIWTSSELISKFEKLDVYLESLET
jgi:hypothetical protein